MWLWNVQEDVKMDVLDGGPVEGFVGFFDVQFRGSPENPSDFPVRQPAEHLPMIAMPLCVVAGAPLHFADAC